MITSSINNSDSNMTSAQMLQINAQGHEIGSHTKNHAHLTQIPLSQAQTEIAGSKADLAAYGATPDSFFVYPYGDYKDAVRELVVNAGYIGARTVQTGYNTKNSDKFLLRDQHVEVNTTPEQIIGYIQTAMATNTWLILEFHDTNYTGDQYSNTPETLQAVVNYIVANHIPVVTTPEGIAMMNL
jgi:peptidoglycan/xylan/chitin deacetylase (PgdA/CDA1 family)